MIDTVMGELAVVCIVDKDDLGELYGSIFVKKQVLEPVSAESRPVPLASLSWVSSRVCSCAGYDRWDV